MIPAQDMGAYRAQLSTLSARARAATLAALRHALDGVDPAALDVAGIRNDAIAAVNDVLSVYAVAGASVACDFSERHGLPPQTMTDIDRSAVERVVRYQAGKLSDGDIDGFIEQVGSFAADSVYRAANGQQMRAAQRGRKARGKAPAVRFARVPSGAETCTFCRMLSSRGFVYWSRETAGELDHFHRNCDCLVVASNDPDGIEGYDPDREYALWRAFEEIDADRTLGKAERERKKRALLGGTGMEIDDITPCLRRMSDGAIVGTRIERIHPVVGDFPDWEFDWSIVESEGYEVRALYADGDDRVQGLVSLKPDASMRAVYVRLVETAPHNNRHNLSSSGVKEYNGVGGHLFAEAVAESIAAGYSGFLVFDAKTSLIDHYREALGAELLFGNRMFIDEGPARRLYERYYGHKRP